MLVALLYLFGWQTEQSLNQSRKLADTVTNY